MPCYNKNDKENKLNERLTVKINAGSNKYIILLTLGLVPALYSDSKPSHSPITQDVWLTVFVHGIISIKPHVTVTNFLRFLNDDLNESLYAETVDIMRDDPFFFQNQTVQERGLKKIDLENQKPGASASLMANLFEQVNSLKKTNHSKNYYYTYGWTGLLSRSARYNDAKEFLTLLEAEVEHYRAQGINPKIRLIGYSHGGTIILKLAMVKRNEQLTPNFTINETFFFGTPIQFDTDYLIADPLFGKVYNIFSRSDRVQKLDFFSCGQFFSAHEFTPHCGFEVLPAKLTQIEIRIIRKKGEGCKPITSASAQEPPIYDGVKCSRAIRNVSPGHTELWFFGWTPLNYRKTFPLYPLPIVVFAPFLVNSIAPFAQTFNPEKPIILTIDPRRNIMVLDNNQCDRIIHKLPFIGIENLLALKEKALRQRPDPNVYNWETFNEHITQAYNEAWVILKEKKCNKKMNAISACK